MENFKITSIAFEPIHQNDCIISLGFHGEKVVHEEIHLEFVRIEYLVVGIRHSAE